ncbi:hypothetical protein FB451DRAFT_1182026 [Mycena latifolia]|nr:hypothetical protein FB451DRAFT_1182026 [Mycena latifolia]
MVEKPNARALSLGPAAREHEDGVNALTLPKYCGTPPRAAKIPHLRGQSVASTKHRTHILSPLHLHISVASEDTPRLHGTADHRYKPKNGTMGGGRGSAWKKKEHKDRKTDRSPAGRLRGPVLRRDPYEGSPNGLQSSLESGSPSGLGLQRAPSPPEVLSRLAKDPPAVLNGLPPVGLELPSERSPDAVIGLVLSQDPPEVLKCLEAPPAVLSILNLEPLAVLTSICVEVWNLGLEDLRRILRGVLKNLESPTEILSILRMQAWTHQSPHETYRASTSSEWWWQAQQRVRSQGGREEAGARWGTISIHGEEHRTRRSAFAQVHEDARVKTHDTGPVVDGEPLFGERWGLGAEGRNWGVEMVMVRKEKSCGGG